MTTPVLMILVAAIAGGLAVYIYFATKPVTDGEPQYVRPLGRDGFVVFSDEQADRRRARLLIALGALAACLIFLAGSLSTLP